MHHNSQIRSFCLISNLFINLKNWRLNFCFQSKPRSTEDLKESNLRTKLALEFDLRTNGLYDHSNALSLLLELFKR